jgi:hypothetical protein
LIWCRPILDSADVQVRPWQWIIIHHTATTFGNAAIVTRWHIDRGFDEMGYDFLIGNGTNSGDGQVEVGTRWPKQKWGAHTQSADNRFNLYGIGICLVGNFDLDLSLGGADALARPAGSVSDEDLQDRRPTGCWVTATASRRIAPAKT